MSTSYTLEFVGDYIHVKLDAGYEITPQGMRDFWPAIAAAVKQHNCHRVLAEGTIASRRLDTLHAFQSADLASQAIVGLSLACCFYAYVPDELSEFFKTVAANRGFRVEFFTDLQAALRWLGVSPHKEPTQSTS